MILFSNIYTDVLRFEINLVFLQRFQLRFVQKHS